MKKDAKKPQIAIYQALGDEQKIRVRIEDENVWLTQKLVAELFNVSVSTVNEHLKNIFESGELDEQSVVRNFRITAADGKGYDTKHYNLDAILAVGYRVRSDRETQFRKWATERLMSKKRGGRQGGKTSSSGRRQTAASGLGIMPLSTFCEI